jgi:hypothetical protein
MNLSFIRKVSLPLLLVLAACDDSPNDSGESNMALMLNGSTDKLVVQTTDDLKLVANSFTLEAWVSATPNNYYQTILEKRSLPVVGDYWLGLDRSGVWRFTAGNYNIDLRATDIVTAGTNYHVAGVFDKASGQAYLYVNGDVVASGAVNGASSMISTDAPLYIGASKADPSVDENLLGNLDEVRIWSVARSRTEITGSMNKRLSGSESGLVAYWNFDQGTGTSVTDKSGKGHTATVAGDPIWIATPFNVQ